MPLSLREAFVRCVREMRASIYTAPSPSRRVGSSSLDYHFNAKNSLSIWDPFCFVGCALRIFIYLRDIIFAQQHLSCAARIIAFYILYA